MQQAVKINSRHAEIHPIYKNVRTEDNGRQLDPIVKSFCQVLC